MTAGADLSADGRYRYSLWRTWDDSLLRMTWIMLNPSTADAVVDDLTVTKCAEFARRNGAGGITVINLYALRATQPGDLLRADHPEGSRNGETWEKVLAEPGSVVAAWGDSAPRGLRPSRALRQALVAPEVPPSWLCLGKTSKGSPRHPSRLGYDTELVPW